MPQPLNDCANGIYADLLKILDEKEREKWEAYLDPNRVHDPKEMEHAVKAAQDAIKDQLTPSKFKKYIEIADAIFKQLDAFITPAVDASIHGKLAWGIIKGSFGMLFVVRDSCLLIEASFLTHYPGYERSS